VVAAVDQVATDVGVAAVMVPMDQVMVQAVVAPTHLVVDVQQVVVEEEQQLCSSHHWA
jgi:hypothetical protein